MYGYPATFAIPPPRDIPIGKCFSVCRRPVDGGGPLEGRGKQGHTTRLFSSTTTHPLVRDALRLLPPPSSTSPSPFSRLPVSGLWADHGRDFVKCLNTLHKDFWHWFQLGEAHKNVVSPPPPPQTCAARSCFNVRANRLCSRLMCRKHCLRLGGCACHRLPASPSPPPAKATYNWTLGSALSENSIFPTPQERNKVILAQREAQERALATLTPLPPIPQDDCIFVRRLGVIGIDEDKYLPASPLKVSSPSPRKVSRRQAYVVDDSEDDEVEVVEVELSHKRQKIASRASSSSSTFPFALLSPSSSKTFVFRAFENPTPAPPPAGSFDSDVALGTFNLRWEDWPDFERWLSEEQRQNGIELSLVNTYLGEPAFSRKLRYVCSRAGTGGIKTYVKKYPERERKIPNKRTDCKCRLIVKQYPGVSVVLGDYRDQHDHSLGNANLPFTQIPRETREYIAGLLRFKVDPDHILRLVHRGVYDNDNLFEEDFDDGFVASRTEFIQLRDIRRMQKEIEAETVRLHKDDGVSTLQWVERLRANGHLLGFKSKTDPPPPGSGLAPDVFSLMVQTKWQQKMFLKHGQHIFWHHVLKGKFLHGKRNRRLDHLLNTLIADVVAYYALKQRRRELGFEGPDLEVKKRKQIIKRSKTYRKEDIRQISDIKFLVPSQSDSTKTYEVDIDNYSCQCLDFPLICFCKHLCAVQTLFDEEHLLDDEDHSDESPENLELPEPSNDSDRDSEPTDDTPKEPVDGPRQLPTLLPTPTSSVKSTLASVAEKLERLAGRLRHRKKDTIPTSLPVLEAAVDALLLETDSGGWKSTQRGMMPGIKTKRIPAGDTS
ncbi:hypothetical protein R3P38DRAFT_2804725 [Favolaschia claudopus]|uniref:SWIM-type domain-containing protein n=1 Tax=Favolaschia claudopus TaxID=2862362 RepID=A0AAV9ZPX5_9AGAR